MTATSALTFRVAESADGEFLRELYRDAHDDLFAAMSLDQVTMLTLANLQFSARQSQYRARYPDSVDELIVTDGEPVGRCWVAASSVEYRVLDVAVLRRHRRRGIAGSAVSRTIDRARLGAVPVRLSVWSPNHAARAMYTGLGFVAAHANAVTPTPGYLELERTTGVGSGPVPLGRNGDVPRPYAVFTNPDSEKDAR